MRRREYHGRRPLGKEQGVGTGGILRTLVPSSPSQTDLPLRVVVACADRRVPLLAPGGAGVHLRGIAGGFGAWAEVSCWVARADAADRGPAAPRPAKVAVFPRGRLPGSLRKHRPWDAAVDARAARRQALRWHGQRPVHLLYERAALFGRIGRLPGAARVVELNAPLAWEAAWYEGEAPRRALLQAEARSLRDADLVVVVSAPLMEYAVRRGVDRARLLLLPNGAPPAPPRVRSTSRTLGYAGTFKPWHGLLEALPSLIALAPDRLELWGDGPLRVPFLRALEEAGLPFVWRGWAEGDDLARARAGWWGAWVPASSWPPPGSQTCADAFGEPIPPPYVSPLKEAEAAASGLPIWRGAGPLEPPAPAPRTWEQCAAEVLRALQAQGVSSPTGSWFNAPRLDGQPGAA